MAAADARLEHGTAIALAGRAALIRGASGSGKSDLALRCVAQPATDLIGEAASLVADDQVLVSADAGRLFVRCPETIRGLIEVRGIGICRLAHVQAAELVLIVDLVNTGEVERLPEPQVSALHGIAIRRIAIAPFEASAPVKLLLALKSCGATPLHA